MDNRVWLQADDLVVGPAVAIDWPKGKVRDAAPYPMDYGSYRIEVQVQRGAEPVSAGFTVEVK